ncbi:M3 family oligoendopeptidase [Sphingobacterium hungaricum]|uniref:M3 family oligoendopeptidase n=1 Tax=Sphingobacterium hungaricum TaxID=2082723 RepID=A0A928YRJ6_9SPHI|nr:M3 family oligoendopeptidase [Sphingobacterium hungaricum]MBE8714240.1 M3 family oligoendopeptidase [Sphingobacterium hungaricum]
MKTALAKPRTYVPEDQEINWESIEPIYVELKERAIESVAELEKWLQDRSELDAVLQEDYAWRYIKMTSDTANEEAVNAFQYFATEIEPKIAPLTNDLDIRLVESPFLDQLDSDKYFIYLRKVRKSLELFREENIPLFTQIQLKQQEYQQISGGLTVEVDGKELTLQQASVFLQDTDRTKREAVWQKVTAKRLEHKDSLNTLFTELIQLRHKVALNAGFENFRDYMFAAMGRFDYGVQDCLDFHHAVAKEVVPVMQQIADERKAKLQIDPLKPWDMAVDPDGLPPLKPFADGEELINKTTAVFNRLNPYIGNCLTIMKDNNLFDVESRIGKAPGGYNYPLAESGAPFIFMNSAGTLRDLTTMVHEGGHAVHTFISSDLELTEFKNLPSEVAELASMSMELFSMSEWEIFFGNEEELKRAKRIQLEDAISTLPWVATIDKFQHWIYTHPEHSIDERESAWNSIYKEFGNGYTNWDNEKDARLYLWQKQLHLFEVPFYYIEYGFAQLGAIALWRNYTLNKELTINSYLDALKLGYTNTIPEIYEVAGIKFDFSQKNLQNLTKFIQDNL